MITINPKTRPKIEIRSIEEIIPYLQKVSKNWKSLTPSIREKLETLLNDNLFFPGMSHFLKVVRKDVLDMRSGTFTAEQYAEIFGWSDSEISDFMQHKKNIWRKACPYTTAQPEFWMLHHGMNLEEARNTVSKKQQILSKRKKKTTANLKNSLTYYTSRGMSEEQGLIEQSKVQRLRRNNCIEYWLSRGFSEEDGKKEISELQKKRSQLSMVYWLDRGYSIEESKEKSSLAIRKNISLRSGISKSSKKFFTELVGILNTQGFEDGEFLFGDNEKCIFMSNQKRFYLDFYHEASNSVIEFDGHYWHKDSADQDALRDAYLLSIGLKTLRIPEPKNNRDSDKYINDAVTFIKDNYANRKHAMA